MDIINAFEKANKTGDSILLRHQDLEFDTRDYMTAKGIMREILDMDYKAEEAKRIFANKNWEVVENCTVVYVNFYRVDDSGEIKTGEYTYDTQEDAEDAADPDEGEEYIGAYEITVNRCGC